MRIVQTELSCSPRSAGAGAQAPVLTSLEWEALVARSRLPRRQAQTLSHLLLGRSDKQIAAHMQISIAAVRTHLSLLFARFGVQGRCELILHCFRLARSLPPEAPPQDAA